MANHSNTVERPATASPAAHTDRDERVSVLVVDDHAGYRSVVVQVVQATAGFESIAEAESSEQVFALFADASVAAPDLVLLDVHLGNESGLDVARSIKDRSPTTEVVLISTAALDELPTEVESCGARGFLPKALLSPEALRQVWQGGFDW